MGEKKVSLTIRLLAEDKMRIKRCAKERSMTLSDYVMSALRERLKLDETPIEERSDLDLMQTALGKISTPGAKKDKRRTTDDRSLMDLIGEYVDKDD